MGSISNPLMSIKTYQYRIQVLFKWLEKSTKIIEKNGGLNTLSDYKKISAHLQKLIFQYLDRFEKEYKTKIINGLNYFFEHDIKKYQFFKTEIVNIINQTHDYILNKMEFYRDTEYEFLPTISYDILMSLRDTTDPIIHHIPQIKIKNKSTCKPKKETTFNDLFDKEFRNNNPNYVKQLRAGLLHKGYIYEEDNITYLEPNKPANLLVYLYKLLKKPEYGMNIIKHNDDIDVTNAIKIFYKEFVSNSIVEKKERPTDITIKGLRKSYNNRITTDTKNDLLDMLQLINWKVTPK